MMKRYSLTLFIALFIIILATPALTSCGNQPAASHDLQPRAAIIDQLYLLEPNHAFIEQATTTLESHGFTVEVWHGENITVDFYRELPKYGYKIIVFRVHEGILLSLEGSQIVPSETTYLFSGETYTTTKYVSEQLTERVSNAMMSDEHPLVFAVNSDFLVNNMEGDFEDTVIISMGCESFYLDDMATAFIQKGASMYVGWSTIVSLKYVDAATLKLLSNLCREDIAVEQAISETMTEFGPDPYFHAYMKHYPAEKGDQTIKQLIKGAY